MSSPDAPASPSAGLMSDATLAALELRRQPFTELPADGDFFDDDTTAEQLADIRQALITGDDLLLILGPRGAGRSTLLAQLAANSGQRIQCFSVRGSPRFSTHNLFVGVLEAFRESPPEELRDVLDALLPHLQQMTHDNLLCTIVLDDADRVAEPELTRLLSGMLYLNSRDETLLRIALSADEAFEERIPELLPEGADLPYSSLVVEPFDADRAGAYLDFRLNQAGRFDAFPFSDREIETINARAGGRPAALHAEAARELESRHANGGDEALPAELMENVRRGGPGGGLGGGLGLLDARGAKMALGALALALILGGLLLSRPAPDAPDEARYRVVEERPVTAAASGPDATGAVVAATDGGVDGGVGGDADGDGAEERLRLVRELSDERAAPDGAAAGASAARTPVATEPLVAEAPAEVAVEPREAPDRVAASETSGDDPDTGAGAGGDGRQVAAAVPEPVAEPDPPAAPPVEPVEPVAAGPSSTPPAEPSPAPTEPLARLDPPEESTPAEPPPAAALPVPAPEAPADAAPEGLESPNWVLVQDPGRFTVQMSASTDRASVESFLTRTGLEAPNSIFAFQRDGVTWYALVHGLFDSIEQARLAIERMPAAAQTNQPWIRGVGRIQAALKAQ